MNRLSFAQAWTVVKEKLKQHYEHLTDDDLTEIGRVEEEWLERLLRHAGGSPLEIAHLVEESLEQRSPKVHPDWLAVTRSEEWRSRRGWNAGRA